MAKKFDFAGWATKNDVRCADGRIIRKNAFADQDGARVPLFWNHQHNDPEMVLGHAILMNMDDGVYAEGYFNDSAKAQHVKDSIAHGDLLALSIYANQLKQDGSNVLHGVIRELSVVPGGANPEALIETAMLAHGDLWSEEVMVFNAEDTNILSHASDPEEVEEEAGEDSVSAVLETLNEKQKRAVALLIDAILNEGEDESEEGEEVSHSADSEEEMDEDTVVEVLETLNDDQKEAVAALIDAIAQDDEEDEEADEDEEYEEDEEDDEISHGVIMDADRINEILETLDDDQLDAVAAVIDSLDELEHSDVDEDQVIEVLETLTDEQKEAVSALIDSLEEEEEDDEEDEEDEEDETEEEEDVKHNVFDEGMNYGPVLSHSDMEQIFADWKRNGSLADTIRHHMEDGVLAHSVYNTAADGTQGSEQTYGIADIDYLFPDARNINTEPDFISRQMDWVRKVMDGVRHTPFSRVKSIHANITMDEARAKGYVKGNRKADEVFSLLKRITTPQTIYKKQKLDKDDIKDITDFNVVAWIKAEMRLMLEEECARAILIGDGRSNASSDKIFEEHIRPIASDASLYTIKVTLDDDADAKALIRSAIVNRKDYKGSGNVTMFTTANWHTEMVLLEDQMGRPLYDTDDKLRTKLRVSSIVDVEPMEGVVDGDGNELVAVLVDLKDYNVGADKGGQTEFFEDFDIDYNQEKYLLETRFSGALVKPYSAIAIYKTGSSSDSDSN